MMGFKKKKPKQKKQSLIKKNICIYFQCNHHDRHLYCSFFRNVYTGGRGTASGIVGKMKSVMLRWTVSHCQGPNVHTEWSGEAVRGVRTVQALGLSPRFIKSLVRLFVRDPVSEFQSVAQPVALETQL